LLISKGNISSFQKTKMAVAGGKLC